MSIFTQNLPVLFVTCITVYKYFLERSLIQPVKFFYHALFKIVINIYV